MVKDIYVSPVTIIYAVTTTKTKMLAVCMFVLFQVRRVTTIGT